jgi:hypothetical protein
MSGAIPTLPHYALMAWRSVKHRDNFTFNFLPFIDTRTFENRQRLGISKS